MVKKIKKVNPVAIALYNPKFRHKVIKSKTVYNRKKKVHNGSLFPVLYTE